MEGKEEMGKGEYEKKKNDGKREKEKSLPGDTERVVAVAVVVGVPPPIVEEGVWFDLVWSEIGGLINLWSLRRLCFACASTRNRSDVTCQKRKERRLRIFLKEELLT